METKSFPIVTMSGMEAVLRMYPINTVEDEFDIFIEDLNKSVKVAHVNSYESAMSTMECIMTSFAALGYNLDTEI